MGKLPVLRIFWLLLVALLLQVNPALATHNLAGQIAAQRDASGNSNSYVITLTTYTDPAPANVDRCKADIEVWTTGPNPILISTLRDIPRANGVFMVNASDCSLSPLPQNGVVVKGTVKRNIYTVSYVFPGPGAYQLRYFDIARHESVVNISNPGDQAFYVETEVYILPPLVGYNNTPILLNEPLYDACAGKLWTDNPGAYDPDGDSLAYSLRPSYQYSSDPNAPVPPMPATGYRFPDDPQFGANSSFTIDPFTGQITWNVPMQLGIYNIAIVVEEWRDGVLLGYVVRDMAIWVNDCKNNPPVIKTINDTCITAGDILEFQIKAWDPDLIDSLYVLLNNGASGNNGPFAANPPASVRWEIKDPIQGTIPWSGVPVRTYNGNNSNIRPDTVIGYFRWITDCNLIRRQVYQADFFAHDNRNYSTIPRNATLAASKSVQIRVIPPAPKNLQITKSSRQVLLQWTSPTCRDYVIGYNVYRKIGGGFNQDTVCCQESPLGMGFQLLKYVPGASNTSLADSLNDITGIFGREICYVVTAIYSEPNPLVQTLIESCATKEECVEIVNDPIYLTNDSVGVTDPANGEIRVIWSQPDMDEFFPSPFTYHLYRANNNGYPAIQIATLGYNDTIYDDGALNTVLRGYNYRVEVFDALGLFVNTSENTNIGSSIYLTATGGNNNIRLSWSEFVPWQNTSYEVYRSEAGGPFVLISTVPGTGANVHTEADNNLDPAVEYCYFIRSYGSHSVAGVKQLLINDSQVACAFARDEEAPCPPTLDIKGGCEASNYEITIFPNGLPCSSDGDSLTLYFSTSEAGPFIPYLKLDYTKILRDTTLIIDRGPNLELAGCWAVSLSDSLGNESLISLPYCTDFCPFLEIANVFSPNADGINDVFKPVRYRDVILRQIQIFDRWGRLMYTGVANIGALWDGNTDLVGGPAPEGVYYYVLNYDELGISGNVPRRLRGWITLVR